MVPNRTLECETESLTSAAQEQAIWTNVIKEKTNKSLEQTKCNMCSTADDTINHIISECPKLAQKEYKRMCIYWEICGANGIHFKSKWYEH